MTHPEQCLKVYLGLLWRLAEFCLLTVGIQWDKRFFSQAASCSEAGICFVVLCVHGKSSSWLCGVLYSVVQYTEFLRLSPPPSLPPPGVCVCIYTHTHLIYIHLQIHNQLPQATAPCERSRVPAAGCGRAGPFARSTSVWADHLCSHTAWCAASQAVGGDRAGRNQLSAAEIKRAYHFLGDSVKYRNHPCPYMRLLLPLVHSPLSLIPKLHHRWVPFNTTNFCPELHKIIV